MPIVKNVERQYIESTFNTASAHTIDASMKDMDATAVIHARVMKG